MEDNRINPDTIPYYERVPHTADLAIRVVARDMPELFGYAAYALFALMTVPPREESTTREVAIESPDYEALLVDWLNELIFLNETVGESYRRFTIDELTDTHLRAHLAGGPAAKKRTIKAATYHDLWIRQTTQAVEAHIVFDV